MHTNEDSEILARLGILASTEQSPKKEGAIRYQQVSTKFVDVNINGDAQTEDESEDDIFDRDTLLIGSRNDRERIPTNSRRHSDTPACRFILLLFSFFAAGLALHSTPDIYLLSMRSEGHILPILQMGGLIIGALIARTYVPRFNSMWLLFVCICVLTTLAIILLSPQDSTSLQILVITQGVCVATIIYAGLSTWFMWWRSSHRKFFWILFACALGATIPTLLRSPMTDDWHLTTALPEKAHKMHRRAIDGLKNVNLRFEEVDAKSTDDNGQGEKPKRPDAAVGNNVSKSKAEENERNRLSITTGITEALPAVISITTSTVTTTTPIPTTEPAITTKETKPAPGKTASGMVVKQVEKIDKAIETKIQNMQSAVLYRVSDLSVEWAVVGVLSTVLMLFILAFFTCCLSWGFIADSRVAKLSDHSSPGLTAGCRLRICACHCLSSAVSTFLMYTAMQEGSSYEILTAVMMAVVMFIAALIGGACCTSSASWIFVLLALLGTILLEVSPASYLGFLLAAASAPMISCSIVMRIEKNVGARPSQNIDMFLLCKFGTKFLLATLCFLLGRFTEETLTFFAFIFAVVLIPMLYLAGISINRAARLKEIYDYTTEHGGEPRDLTRSGNYTMLEVPSGGETDEDEV